jgi:GntR family transcriptional regulator, rspAB operon transcriptional repressor
MLSGGSLTDRAYHMLRAAILRGEIEEGKFLSEATAREQFKVGHTPFREACNRLLDQGFLEPMPRRGYFVPQMTMRKARNLLDARIVIESQVAELAAARATKAQLDAMAGLLKQRVPMDLNADTVDAIVSANTDFHHCLAEMTQNHEIVQMVDRLVDRSARLVYPAKIDRPGFRVHTIHQQIFDALKKRDARGARRLIIADIQAGQSELLQFGQGL